MGFITGSKCPFTVYTTILNAHINETEVVITIDLQYFISITF